MKHAAYCGTREIYFDIEAAAKSLIANSDVDVVHFIIEDDEFPHELPDIIQVHNLSGQEFFAQDGPNMKSGYTYMAMMRAALCHVLPDVDRVLSLDVDTVCLRDVSPLWELPIEDSYYAATPEWHRSHDGQMYCNTGVALYNLDKLRDGKADEVIWVLNHRQYTWLEQDVFNYLCQGRIYEMPSWYNSNHWTDRGNDLNPRIRHYAGIKRDDWSGESDVRFYRNMDWDEVLDRHV